MKLLIVDDHQSFRGVVKAVLRRNGSCFVECADGSSALARYTVEQPDWVVMDIQMEPMDGLTATRAIRARDPLARIVILTGGAEPGLQTAALEAGALFFLPKSELLSLRGIIYGGSQPGAPERTDKPLMSHS